MEYKSEKSDSLANESVFSDDRFQAPEDRIGVLVNPDDVPASQSLVPDYIEVMQLDADPFSSVAHSPNADFLGAGRQEILEQVDHLSEFSASVLVVSGAAGSGKTTLFTNLCQRLASHWKLCSISAQVLSSTELIFEHLATALGVEAASGASAGELMVAIRHRLMQDELEPFMLLVDDAHLLDDTVLGALMSLLQSNGLEGELPFHVILLGDEALIHRLDGFSLVDVLLHDLSLQPFGLAEASEYLLHRLKWAGWIEDLPFDEGELSQLHIESGGNPARLNDAARRLLINRVTINYEQLEGSAGLPIAHLFSVVVLLGVLIMAYFYKDSWFAEQEQAMEAAQMELLQDRLPLKEGGAGLPGSEASPFKADMSERQATLQNQSQIFGSAASAKQESQLDQPELDSPQSVADKTEFKGPKAVVSSGAQEFVNLDLQEPPEFSLPQPVIPQPVDELKADAEEVVGPSFELAQLAAPAARHSTPSVSSPPEVVATERIFTDALTADEQVLMGLSAGRFVLQIMAAGSKASVESFIASQPNRRQLKLFTTWRQGKPWYVVVVGDFDSSLDARQGVAELPPAQKKAGPWPRSVANIQSTIKDFRRI